MMSSDATPRDVNLELRQAVYRGDLDAVRLCLDEGGCVTGTFFFPGLARDPFHDLTEDFQMTILTLWRKATNPSSTYSSSRVVSSPASAPRIATRNAGACGSIEIWSRSSRRFWW